jgi:uncharacterized membrane protein
MSNKGGGMKGKLAFLKTTVIGGIVFLVPLIIFIVIIGKALEIMAVLAMPLAGFLPIESIGGFAVANLISIVSIVLLCFLAGLAARTAIAGKLLNWIESTILSKIPIYAFVKGMTESVAGIQNKEGLKPVLVEFDDRSQIGFEVERIEGGSVAVYVPGSPNPWSGAVLVMKAERVKPLDVPLTSALQSVTDFGQGTNSLLRGRV